MPAGRVDTALEFSAALTADDFARERISVLVLILIFFYAFFFAMLFDDSLRGFKVLAADNCIVMIFNEILVFFTIIVVAVEVHIGVSLLKNSIACVFFIADYSTNCCRRPTAAFLGWNVAAI